MAIELNRDNFEAEMGAAQQPVLVDFWGPQCGPCLAMMPAIEALEREYAGKVTVAKVDVTKNRMLCAKLRLLSVPAILLFKNGSEVRRLVGDEVTIESVKEALAASMN